MNHPQTDRLTQRTNQALETYLRRLSSRWQDDCVDWWPVAEFYFKISAYTSTQLTPFYSWQGFLPRANGLTSPFKIPRVNAFVKVLESTQVQLIEALRHEKLLQAKSYNEHTHDVVRLTPGSLVWLSLINIPSTYLLVTGAFARSGSFIWFGRMQFSWTWEVLITDFI